MEKNFYVDDYLRSLESYEKAISSVDQLRNLLPRGGFNMVNGEKVEDSKALNLKKCNIFSNFSCKTQIIC